MLWTEDYRVGGFPRRNDISNELFRNCSCDGMFSESDSCRRLIDIKRGDYYDFDDPRSFGVCGNIDAFKAMKFSHTFHFDQKHTIGA